MAYIQWDKSLSVNIASIDEQHKVLINMINEFYENIKNKSNNELILQLIGNMKDYIVMHFKTEEEYFQKFNYPEKEHHFLEDKKFVDKVSDLEKRYNDNKVILTFEITSFLKNWIKSHIQVSDKRYSGFLIQHGVK